MPLKSQKNPTRSKCCVEGCATRICSGVPMHGFPRVDKYPELYQHWVDAIRLNNKTPFWIPRKSNRVCAFHFETVEHCRIRVPTVFPNIENQAPSTSEEQSYEDFDEDIDPTSGDYEEDPMDAYEVSIAANNIMPEHDSTLSYGNVENTDSSMADDAFIDEDSAMTYEDIEDIEERYNTIVGDVVSTLVTDDNVMDENTNITYNEADDDAPMYFSDLDEHSTTPRNNDVDGLIQQGDIEEEIIYDDNIFDDGDNSTIQTQIFSAEQIGLNQEELRDNEYCVVVVRHESDETKMESTKKVVPDKSKIQSPSKKITTMKGTDKNSGKKGHKKSTGKMLTIKAAKSLPSSLEPSSASTPSEESAAVPEDTILALSEEVKERLLSVERVPKTLVPKNITEDNDAVRLQEQDVLGKEGRVKSPCREVSPCRKVKVTLGVEETSHTLKKSPVKLNQKTLTSKDKKKEMSPIQKSLVEQRKQRASSTEGKGKAVSPIRTPLVEQPNTAPSEGEKKEKMPPSRTAPVELEAQETAPSEGDEDEKIPSSKIEEKEPPSESDSVKSKEIGKVKIDGLLLDGEPIKLKECSVNIVKTPVKAISKKKAPSAPKVKNVVEKKETSPSGNVEQDSAKSEEIVAGASSDFLNALSLKSSLVEESGSSGLRRSARIRAGAGQRRKFGTRSSWSVALKNRPKKRPKIELDETSQSSESVPYDFEDEDDPEVGVSDLEDSDTTMSEAESDISSRSEHKPERKPQPKLNGVTTRKRCRGGVPYSSTAEGPKRAKFHGYQRVRLGDQATQVGLPGRCDGFIFNVVRDDPCNVGVSCNIFYHYQPKRYKPYSSTWVRVKGKVDTRSTAETKTSEKTHKSSDSNHQIEATIKDAQKVVDDRPNEKRSISSMQNKNHHTFDDTEELVEVVDDIDRRENVDLGDNEAHKISAYPENIYTGGEIKVESAMDVAPSVEKEDEASQKTDDINSLSNTAGFAEVEVKEEEEFHSYQDTEMVRVDQSPCIVTDLREVRHGDAENTRGVTDSSSRPRNTLPEPGFTRGDKLMELVDADDTAKPEGPAEESCSLKRNAENYVDIDTHADDFEEAMDTSDASPREKVDRANSFRRTGIFMECPSGTLSNASRETELVREGNFESITENVVPPSVATCDFDVCSDSGNAAKSLLDVGNTVGKEGSESRREVMDLSGAYSCAFDSPKEVENITAADSPKPAKASSDAEMSGSKNDSENVEEDIDSNVSEDRENSVERSSELTNFAMSSEPQTEVEVPCDSRDGGSVEPSRDSDGIQAETSAVVCLDAVADSEMHAEAAPDAVTSDSRTDLKNLMECKDSDNAPAHTGCEAECREDLFKSYSGKSQDEAVERPNSPDFSSDSSNDSLIPVPIPDIDDSDDEKPVVLPPAVSVEIAHMKPSFPPAVRESHEKTTAEELPRWAEFNIENPSAEEDRPSEPNLDYRPQNKGKPPKAREVADSPTPKTLLSNENLHPEEGASNVQCESTQEVFDTIERDLEKMFDMDS